MGFECIRMGCLAPLADSVATVGLAFIISSESMPMQRSGRRVCGRARLSS